MPDSAGINESSWAAQGPIIRNTDVRTFLYRVTENRLRDLADTMRHAAPVVDWTDTEGADQQFDLLMDIDQTLHSLRSRPGGEDALRFLLRPGNCCALPRGSENPSSAERQRISRFYKRLAREYGQTHKR